MTEQTAAILRRLVWWRGMKGDVEKWVGECLVCLRFRKRPTKNATKGVARPDAQ